MTIKYFIAFKILLFLFLLQTRGADQLNKCLIVLCWLDYGEGVLVQVLLSDKGTKAEYVH